MTPFRAVLLFSMLMGITLGPTTWAGPTVVPTAEGQIGETPTPGDAVGGPRFESVRGDIGDLIFGGLAVPGGPVPPPPEFQFLSDMIHDYPDPVPVLAVPAQFQNVDKQPPASGWSRNAANDGDFVAFSFAVDGAMPQTMTVRIATFDETGSSMVNVPIIENIPTFPIPDPSAAETGVAVDNQGRVTVVYTELEMGTTARVRAQRIDAVTGVPIGGDFPISDVGRASTDVALLDPAGDRLIVPVSSFNTIRGAIVDTTGPTPVVSPEFPISTTPAAFAHLNPAVAANPSMGNYTVVWEDITTAQFNPIDIRARRFDANGNPVGDDFVVNTTTDNAQIQPSVSYDPDSGASAIAWSGDASVQGDGLDVFLQVYDADGNPIGGEIRANTTTLGFQDRPAVRFMPERDDQGRPQVTVAWRDVANADGTGANGTGTSYKCFAIEGLGEPGPIFADGFESGDTSSWSDTVP